MSEHRDQRGTGTKIGLTMLILALLGAVVGFGTWSAFSATTSNTGNDWSAGTVSITDDDGGSAMFTASDMKPGDSVTGCIEVEYTGSLTPATVALYGSTGGTGLAAYLDLTVEIGTGGTYADCSGFSAASTVFTGTLSGFSTSHSDYASGAQDWSPASTPETRTFRFQATLQDDNAAQGLNATATFTWEAQS